MGTSIKTLGRSLWFPLLSGALTAVATWLVWHYTALHCTPANAAELLCRPTALSPYITPEILQDCIINASIAITLTGGSDLMLFIRERQRADRLEDVAQQAVNEAIASRKMAEERAARAEERAEARTAKADERAEARTAKADERAEARAAKADEWAEARAAKADERAAQAEERAARAEQRAEERAAQAEARAARAEERAIVAHQAFLDALHQLTAGNGPSRPPAATG